MRKKSFYDEYENHLRDGDDLIIDTPAHKNNYDEVGSDDAKRKENHEDIEKEL